MKFPLLTMRERLTLVISFSALLILLLEGYFIYSYSVRFCEQEFRERLQERLALADSIIAKDRAHPFTAIGEIPPGYLPDEKILYFTDPRQIALPNGANPFLSAVDTTQFHKCIICFAHIGRRDYGIRHDPASHHTLVISAVDRYGQTKIQNLRNAILSGIALGVLLLTLVSWFWIKKMLQPIADKIKKARAIGTKSLNLRLEVKNNYDELGQLALTFNAMLERIEQGFRTQQEFIRNASHEMRTPLTAITAEADLALQQTRDPEHYRQALENIRRQAENLNHLVSQLLILAKVDAAAVAQPCAADEALLSAMQMLKSGYPEAGQRTHIQIDASQSSDLQVACDPAILQTAYFNLLENAIKYGNNRAVRVRLFLLDKAVCLEVEDKGAGIDPKEMERLFEPFYRSDKNRALRGSGIGLSLVKSVADQYGGHVRMDSQLGIGTTVHLRMPKYDADHPGAITGKGVQNDVVLKI
jgi:signal transduction histidine kinase